MNKALGAAGAVIAALTLNSCAQTVSISMGNPSASNCSKQGGKLRTVTGPDLDRSICELPDGSAIEEWVQHRKDPAAK
ncbi:MAG: DUF333 domain-containing protein [Comamonas sp.]|nr:DUF333 domain-containing protein [Comamonas sp.]